MPLNDHNAYPTADTFHAMRIHEKMALRWSAEENIIFYSHIVRHQLTNLSTNLHLPDVCDRLGIGRFLSSEGYVSVVIPSISRAIKSRIRALAENKDTRPFLQGVIDGTRIRFYPVFMDAWAKPGWIGNMKKPLVEAVEDEAPLASSKRTEPMFASVTPPTSPRRPRLHREQTRYREWWKSPLAWNDAPAEKRTVPDNLTPPMTPPRLVMEDSATGADQDGAPAANLGPTQWIPPRPPLSLMGVNPPLLAVAKERLLKEYSAALCEILRLQLIGRLCMPDRTGRIVQVSEMERSTIRELERTARMRATQLDQSLSEVDLPSGVGLGFLGDLLRIDMY
ncbi:hypothetical protein LZ30DRAFT_784779 [Colletotrichum cereale]|nr:hypothetical protein LZ30DRAFT_784779 [Colletotrichum cereale]